MSIQYAASCHCYLPIDEDFQEDFGARLGRTSVRLVRFVRNTPTKGVNEPDENM